MSGPLEGVRIIDLTAVLMGPFATQILGDYGAEVIKVEPPAGDTSRWLVPVKNKGLAAPFSARQPQQARHGAGSQKPGWP